MINVVIPASGMGFRFGADIPKQFLLLNDKEILQHTIEIFQNINQISEIVVTVPPGFASRVRGYNFSKVKHIVEGGESRSHSVYLALQHLPKTTDVVLVHDGVRPFITEEKVLEIAEKAEFSGAAVACTPVTDTIKKAAKNGIISKTLDRSKLWNVQTPQGFTYDILMEAYQKNLTILSQFTDDSSIVERNGIPVHIVACSARNIKITTIEDLKIAKFFLEEM